MVYQGQNKYSNLRIFKEDRNDSNDRLDVKKVSKSYDRLGHQSVKNNTYRYTKPQV